MRLMTHHLSVINELKKRILFKINQIKSKTKMYFSVISMVLMLKRFITRSNMDILGLTNLLTN